MSDRRVMRVENATRQQMGMFQECALREGWQPGSGDVDAFHATDPYGFYLGVDQNDAAIAMISLVKYSSSYAFLGYYIVAPDARGKGFGRRIWDHAVGQLPGVTIGLDGVLAQEEMYEKEGFRTQYYTVRYTGRVCDLQRELTSRHQRAVTNADTTPDSLGVRGATSFSLESLVAYDAHHVPVPRQRFLQQWLFHDSQRRGLVATTGDAVCGMATIRPSLPSGYRIGPLFADDVSVATQLLWSCVAELDPHQTCSIDVPTSNRAATDLVQGIGMAPGFTAARMYRGTPPARPNPGVWGVTSLELG